MNTKKMNEALKLLTDKYAVRSGTLVSENGVYKVRRNGAEDHDVLPWRVERRFTELKKMIDTGTLENVSTLRFAAFASEGQSIEALLAREIDLAQWLIESPVKRVFAVCSPGNKTVSAILKFENEMSASIECSVGLPAGALPMDRHEIIARRGVASDRVVDTQVPQASIYLFNEDGERRYTDVDAELFGFSEAEIWIVRAAFAVLSKPQTTTNWNVSAIQMNALAQAAFESDRTETPVVFTNTENIFLTEKIKKRNLS